MVTTYARRTAAAVVIGVVLLSGCTAQTDRSGGAVATEPLVLHGINTRAALDIQPFVDQVAALSGGAITIAFEEQWHSSSIAGEAEAIKAVRTGAADFAVVPARAWHKAGVTDFDALIAPMLVDTLGLQEAVLQDPMVDDMLAAVEPIGLTGIGVLPGPLRVPAGISRELLTPNDFQGAAIAISPGEIPERSLRALGATPVASAFEGSSIAPFDGVELHVAAIGGNRGYDEVIRTVTANTSLWPRPLIVVANADAAAALSADQLAMLRTAARNAVPATTQLLAENAGSATDGLCRRGNLMFKSATTADREQLREAFGPVIESMAADPQTAAFLTRIEALRDGSTPAVVTCSAPSTAGSAASAANARTPMDGTYQMTATVQDLVDFGIAADQTRGNAVSTTLAFDRGHFTDVSTDGSTNWRAAGSYLVNGDKLTMTYTDSAATGPDADVARQPGEVDTWLWSLYDDQLQIRWADPSKGVSEYPSNYAVNPWTRIGDADVAGTTPTG